MFHGGLTAFHKIEQKRWIKMYTISKNLVENPRNIEI